MNTTDKTAVIGTRIPRWTSAYYAGWMQGANNDGYLKAEKIDYSAVTAVIHFSVIPRTDGTLDSSTNLLTQTNSKALLQAAHAAGTKVLFSIGGDGAANGFKGATSPDHIDAFTTNLVNFMTNNSTGYGGEKYDGIDIDWEPLAAGDEMQYASFIDLLKKKLSVITPQPILTAAAVKEQPKIFAKLQDRFDQINIMTYDLAGPWEGWVSWHNSPVYDGGYRFPSTGALVPSTDHFVKNFINAGVPANKLGIGIDFYGKKWSGVYEPRQALTANTTMSGLPYSKIMSDYYQMSFYHWDEAAQAAYLSIPMSNSGLGQDYFISYDDETSVQKKIDYVSQNGLGGVIIWELAGGWRPQNIVPDYLLKAVKKATRWMPI